MKINKFNASYNTNGFKGIIYFKAGYTISFEKDTIKISNTTIQLCIEYNKKYISYPIQDVQQIEWSKS